MNIPQDLKYAESHEWVRVQDGVATVGITDHAQNELTDVVFVEVPDVGREVEAGESVAVVESVKAASDIYSPVGGTIEAVNEDLEGDPALVNNAPYQAGWLFKVKLSDPSELDKLMDAAAYGGMIG